MDNALFPTSKALENLQLELSLLQVLHHRNKNQLCSQPFFKHLSILRRTLNLLLENVDSEYLLQKLRRNVIPHAWASFSQLIARGEFVTLALVLCASVARIASSLGGIDELSMNSEVDVGGEFQGDPGEVIPRPKLAEEDLMEVDKAIEYEWTEPQRSPEFPNDKGPDRSIIAEMKEEVITSIRLAPDNPTIGEIERPAKKRKKNKAEDDIDRLFARLI